jgi:hypothetical protein
VPTFTEHVEYLLRQAGCGESVDDVYAQLGIVLEERENKADWLLRKRSIVVEFKELTKINCAGKVAEVMRPRAAETGRPHGFVDVDEVIGELPDGAELSNTVDDIITSVLRQGIQDANSQIRDTKRRLKLNTALGLVVVFNSSNALLNERHIAVAMDRQLLRRAGRFGSINAAAVLSPHLEVTGQHGAGAVPFLAYPYPSLAGARASDAVNDISGVLAAKYTPGRPSIKLGPDARGRFPVRQRFGEPVIVPEGTDPSDVIKAREAARARRPLNPEEPLEPPAP